MNTLVSISPEGSGPDRNESLRAHRITSLPIVVISPHNQCNCRCVMCDIWKIREAQEMQIVDMERLLRSFNRLGVRWVVFTGGEPQLNARLFDFAGMLRSEGVRVTLLTAGLLLEDQAEEVANHIDDLIVSLDGPATIHDRIRRVPRALDRLRAGIQAVQRLKTAITVRGRCTVQKTNYNALRATVQTAKDIGLWSISFLAADVTSAAFNHPQDWPASQRNQIALTLREVDELEAEIEALITFNEADLRSGFVVESVDKLRRIARHFRVCLGEVEAVSPLCNAPWHSTVIDASGNVRPCFFHQPLGNIHDQSLPEVLNGPRALQFRHDLNIAMNPVCRNCVCSLHYQPEGSRVVKSVL